MNWQSRLREDLQAARDRDPAARSSLEVLLAYPGVHALLIHRVSHRLWLANVPVLPRVISHLGRFLLRNLHENAARRHGVAIQAQGRKLVHDNWMKLRRIEPGTH